MPLSNLIQPLSGTCRYCGQRAGILKRDHPGCLQNHQAGIQEMIQLAAQAAGAHTFNEAALRQTLGTIAQRSRATGEDIDRALEERFRQGVTQAMSDGILTRQEEERLRTFRDSLALEDNAGDSKTMASLDQASSDRIMMEARLAAISVANSRTRPGQNSPSPRPTRRTCCSGKDPRSTWNPPIDGDR